MSTTWQTPISSFETNRRRVGALKSLGVVSVGDALTYYPFRVTDPVPARALREAKIGENMAFAAHVRGVRVFPMARRGFRLIADVDDGDFARSRHMDASMASLVFFSYRKSYVDWIQRKLHEGALLVVAGEPSVYNDRLQFTHPDILTVDPAGEQLRSRSSEEAAEWDDGFGTEQPAVVPQSPTMPNLKYDAASVPEAMRHVCRPRPVYHANSRISSEHIHERSKNAWTGCAVTNTLRHRQPVHCMAPMPATRNMGNSTRRKPTGRHGRKRLPPPFPTSCRKRFVWNMG